MKLNLFSLSCFLLFLLFSQTSCDPVKKTTTQTNEESPKKTTVVDPSNQTVMGKCIDESKISDGPCTKEYIPVCGCDGKTYSNKCVAERAGLTKYSKGVCNDGCIDQTKINREMACPRNYDPVCACNGKTYSNDCVAQMAGVLKFKAGKCEDCIDVKKADPDRGCPENWDPVCGCNGRTYGNICEAEKAGIKRWTAGECK